jgi:hypothetical protein
MWWRDGVGDGPRQVRRPASFQDFPLRDVRFLGLDQGMTLRNLRIYTFADPVEHRGRFAIHRRGTILGARAASGRVCSDWSVRRQAAYVTQDEVMQSLAHKSSVQLTHEYKSRAKEQILYQHRVNGLHSELKITIWVARRLLTESWELLHRIDASLAASRSERYRCSHEGDGFKSFRARQSTRGEATGYRGAAEQTKRPDSRHSRQPENSKVGSEQVARRGSARCCIAGGPP